MLSQHNQSMTKTTGPISPIPLITPTMENANNIGVLASGSSTTTTSPPNNTATSDMKMGASVSVAATNNSSNSSGCGSAGCGGGGGTMTTTVGGNTARIESGSANAEHIPKLVNILPAQTQCTYTPCYCEENVWKLCDKVRTDFASELEYCHVAFISNKKRMVPMWRQKAGKNEEKLALWIYVVRENGALSLVKFLGLTSRVGTEVKADYHVIFFYNPDERCVVFDMDSELPFPTHFHRYVSETFRTENILQPEYHRFFRIIPASRFLSLFSSDRSHMLRPEDKSWIKPPPNYPAICNSGVNNLEQFIDMTEKNEFGEVFTLMELVRKFYKPRQLS